jgi:hypothetical protein
MRIPKLDEAGGNRVIYKDQFLWSIDACSYLKHVDGTSIAPGDLVMCTDASQVLTVAETMLDIERKKDLKTWKQGEVIFKLQMAAMISDSLFMKNRAKISGKPSQGRTSIKKGDVRAQFTQLHTMRKKLAAMVNHLPSKDDFYFQRCWRNYPPML